MSFFHLKNKKFFIQKITFIFVITLSCLSHSSSNTQFENIEFFKVWKEVIDAQNQLKKGYLELEKIVHKVSALPFETEYDPEMEKDMMNYWSSYWSVHADMHKAYQNFFEIFKDERLKDLYERAKIPPPLPNKQPANWPQKGIGMAFPETYYLHSELEKFNQVWSENFGDKTKAQEQWNKVSSSQ